MRTLVLIACFSMPCVANAQVIKPTQKPDVAQKQTAHQKAPHQKDAHQKPHQKGPAQKGHHAKSWHELTRLERRQLRRERRAETGRFFFVLFEGRRL